MPRCEHYDGVTIREVPEGTSTCPACVASGDTWVHLRMCVQCGHVGCCDSSKNRHARAHRDESGHELMRSAERGEDWGYCYAHDQFTRLRNREGGTP